MMEFNVDERRQFNEKRLPLTYLLVGIYLSDGFYQLSRLFISVDFNALSNFIAYWSELWQSNKIVTLMMIFVCLLGLPRFISSLTKIGKVMAKLIKAMMKQPKIFNVPMVFYIILFVFKIAQYSPDGISHSIDLTPNHVTFWQTMRENLSVHAYSSLFTLSLFLLGFYNTLTYRWSQTLLKRAVQLFQQQLKLIKTILSISIPTPLSLIILIVIKTFIDLYPKVFSTIYAYSTPRVLFILILIGICLPRLYRWAYPSNIKFDLDFNGDIAVNDVSRLNSVRIHSLFYPRTINDIEYLIFKAKSEGRTISLRGQAHTMGGQTLPNRHSSIQHYVCDLKYLNRVEYDSTTEDILVEAGATWTHVIKKLNDFGRSPVIMQSYCTFSVAGTISVNAHGITSDDAMYESVISIEYIDMNGEHGECSREKNPELFSLMIGGYGLFGIITRLRLKTVSNVKTSLEYIRLQSDQFPKFYEDFLHDSSIEIKIARVDLISPNNILMFIFRQQLGTFGTIADLSDEARVMHPRQHLIYTYLAQHRLFRRFRFAMEKALARPLDLTYSTDRNTTMYESAKPMALLYQPLTYYDDTFILQEYFIPQDHFQQWYQPLQTILRKKYSHVFLLNLTIRFVKKDETTFLAYTKRNSCYAFVFYFRIKRNEDGDRQVKAIHQELIQLAFQCQGTFYLPYRQHYTYEQILHSYPMFDQFFEKKRQYDPIGLFSNDWYEHYRPKHLQNTRIELVKEIDLITHPFEIVPQRRTDSFYRVIRDEILREKFRKFLRTVFDAEPVHVIFNYVNRAVRNPMNKTDEDIYREIKHVLQTRQFAFFRRLFALYKQIRQLRLQISDLLRQQMHVFRHLGYCGKIQNIVSIGDGGRCLNELRQILKINNGHFYLLNDRQRLTDIIERNSLFAPGKFLSYDFQTLPDVPIPSQSIDLVVCYMGVHHLPQDRLETFLRMVYRLLRPNGLFIFREHHAEEELKPLLDVAHMVFNVVTGVDEITESKEIRAFRTVEQWRSIARHVGFEDTFIYDEQEDDPSDDIMITVRKPAHHAHKPTVLKEIINKENFSRITAFPESNYFRPCEWLIVRIAMQFGQYLNHTPFYYFPYITFLRIYWHLCFTETKLAMTKFGWRTALTASPGFMMNVVVGAFLTLAFLQLAFFSFLIVAIPGARLKPEYEQLILKELTNDDDEEKENFDFCHRIDSRIDRIERSKENHLYAIRVPRHHVFTGIIKKLASETDQFNLISISEQTDILHMEITIDNRNAECLLWFKQQPNIHITYEYINPIDKHLTCLVFQIKVDALFPLIRQCQPWEEKNLLTIVQIYDHFD